MKEQDDKGQQIFNKIQHSLKNTQRDNGKTYNKTFLLAMDSVNGYEDYKEYDNVFVRQEMFIKDITELIVLHFKK